MDKHKIIGCDKHHKNNCLTNNNFNNYYKTITRANQIQAISTERTQALPYIPDNLQGKEKKLTRHEILASSKFGRPGLNHSFTTEASFEHVFIFILKNNYMSKLDKTNLLSVHPLFKHFDKMLSWSYNIQFANIKEPIKIIQVKHQLLPQESRKCLLH